MDMPGALAVAAANRVNGPGAPCVASATCPASAICVWMIATWVVSRAAASATCCSSSRRLLLALTNEASQASTSVSARTTAVTPMPSRRAVVRGISRRRPGCGRAARPPSPAGGRGGAGGGRRGRPRHRHGGRAVAGEVDTRPHDLAALAVGRPAVRGADLRHQVEAEAPEGGVPVDRGNRRGVPRGVTDLQQPPAGDVGHGGADGARGMPQGVADQLLEGQQQPLDVVLTGAGRQAGSADPGAQLHPHRAQLGERGRRAAPGRRLREAQLRQRARCPQRLCHEPLPATVPPVRGSTWVTRTPRPAPLGRSLGGGSGSGPSGAAGYPAATVIPRIGVSFGGDPGRGARPAGRWPARRR